MSTLLRRFQSLGPSLFSIRLKFWILFIKIQSLDSFSFPIYLKFLNIFTHKTSITMIPIHLKFYNIFNHLDLQFIQNSPILSKNFNHLDLFDLHIFNHSDLSRAPPAWRQTSNLSAKLPHYLNMPNTDCYQSK